MAPYVEDVLNFKSGLTSFDGAGEYLHDNPFRTASVREELRRLFTSQFNPDNNISII